MRPNTGLNIGFFDSSEFMPHGHCFLWLPEILWLHVISDFGVALAYLLIPLALIWFVRKRPDIPFQKIFLLFGAFILLCALTHLMSIWTFWHPDYAIEGVIKAITALVSLATFGAIVQMLPVAVNLPSPNQMKAVNDELTAANAELKRLNRQLQENDQSHLRAVVDNALDGLITIDQTGRIVTFNPACARIFGYQPEEVIGQNIRMLMPEPYHSEHDGYLGHYHDTGEARIIGTAGREVLGLRKDASTFPIDLSVSTFTIDGVRHYSGILRDITARKAVESALKDSEARYDMVLKGLSVGVWDWDIEAGTMYWSEKLRDILGIPEAEPLPPFERAASLLHPDDEVRVRTMLTEHLEGKGPFEAEYRMRYADGADYVWVHGTGQCQRDDTGKPIRMVGSVANITARKTAELQLKEEASRTRAITDTLLDGLITIDDHGTIQTFNPAATRIFGYQPEEVTGHNVKMLMPEPYHGEHDGYLRHYLGTGEKKIMGIGREVSGQRKDGSVFPMDLGVNELRLPGTRMFVGTVRDISERKDAEAAITDYVEKLKQSNQELDDFAYIASHDLKEPIRGLSNNALFLSEDYSAHLDDGGKRRLDRMVYLCKRMETLVDDLLYFSRLGRQQLAVQKADLNAIIRDIGLMMETTLEENHAEIVIPKPLPVITCDVPRVTEVFRNLITNGVKYNDKPHKKVEIGVEKPTKAEPGMVFYVKDNGIGIAPQFHTDIFRIFKRLNEEADTVKGTGVGLTFVKKIIERHGGRIWLKSTPGKGTTFYFTLEP